jgi:hypothetical protein
MVLDRTRGKSYYDMHKESIFSKKSDKVQEDTEVEEQMNCNKKSQLIIYSPLYVGATTALNVLSLSQLLTGQIILAQHPTIKQLNYWGAASVVINGFFLIDLTINIVVFGFYYIVENKKVLLLETVL